MATSLEPTAASFVVRPRRDLRRLWRYLSAAILPLPATAVAFGRLFLTDDSDTRKALDLIAADPSRATTFARLGFVAILTMVPAFLAAGALARRRRPTLTTIAVIVNCVAYLGGWGLAALDNMYVAAARLPVEQRDGAAALIDAMWSTGLPGVSVLLMVIGHVLGAILMGLALRGSIPALGWGAMIASQPAHVIAFVFFSGILLADALAWGLMSLGFVLCARAILRTPDEAWDLPPLQR